MTKVKVVINTAYSLRACPQGKLNNNHGTPGGPKCS